MDFDGKNRPYWYEHADTTNFPHLMENASCDTAVIGGGITGLTAALALSQAGHDVILIDLNRIGRGTTGHSTGHLDNHYDIGLTNLVKYFGLSAARTFIHAKRHAIDCIEDWNKSYRLDSDFQRIGGCYYAEDADGVQAVQDEIDAANKLELNMTACNTAPLPFETAKAMCLPEQARFLPMVYVLALSRFIFLLGGRIYEMTRMEDFHEQHGKILIETTHGRIEANHLILAGHTSLTGKLSLQSRIFPHMSFVIAAQVEDEIEDALYWDTHEPYFYTRIASTQEPRLLIIGGADRQTGDDKEEDPFQTLEAYARQRYRVSAVPSRWSHEYFTSADGLPFVGRVPWADRVYVAAAYSGDGLTLGTAAGLLLSDIIAGRDNPLAEVLSPERVKPGVAGPKVAHFVTHIGRHFVKDRISHYEYSVEAIPPGEGRLIKIEDHVHAVYKDAEGKTTVMSPVCRHMGCIVHWNRFEQTWDCPCHGGRYNCYGHVFTGPPRNPLKREPAKVLEARTALH
ncbi:MAG: FAD-dependent oxidoreductase [Planctomycetaceae bacterium]|nr:FAD-dependent oxidoreductase [Planctomycetaceae bacterium]